MRNTQLSDLAVNVEADALAKLMDGGFIDIYDGKQPESGDEPLGKQTLLVTLSFNSPAFTPARGGVLTANPITGSVAVGEGKAGWARIYKSDHKTKIMDQSVGTANANIILPTTSIAKGITVSCSSFTHEIAKATAGS